MVSEKRTNRALRPGALAGLVVLLSVAVIEAGASSGARASDLEDGNVAFDAGQYHHALKLWSAAAQAGDPQAAFNLGLLYDLGDGVAESAETAFTWYRRAAQAGLPSAAFNVGVMYDSGRGAPADRAEAAIWYARSAALGEARAAFNLGQLYEWGQGVPRNIDAAIAWYTAAAPTIAAAASKATALAGQRAAPGTGPLVPPSPAWPTDGSAVPLAGQKPAVQLVWTAPAEPSPVTYFVELQASESGSFREITSSYVPTTALAVTLPDDQNFAWRVYAVATDGSAYAPSAWTRFGTAEAELAEGQPGSRPNPQLGSGSGGPTPSPGPSPGPALRQPPGSPHPAALPERPPAAHPAW
jgi:Sel1 repeat